jgi:hypothetical protein
MEAARASQQYQGKEVGLCKNSRSKIDSDVLEKMF